MTIAGYIATLDSKKTILLLLFAAAVVYFNSSSVYFIWDDYSLILNNPDIRRWNFANMFKPLVEETRFNLYNVAHHFRPLQALSYTFDYQIWGLNPFGYHLTTIILHSLAAILIFYLLRAVAGSMMISGMLSIIFVVNPVFTSSVTYLSGRADILLLFFSLLMIICFLRCRKDDGEINFSYYGISVFSFACSLLSKEIAVINPIILCLADRMFSKPLSIKKSFFLYFPYLLVLSLYFYIKPPFLVSNWQDIELTAPHPVFFLLTLSKTLLSYTLIAVFPHHLYMGRSINVINSFSDWHSYIAIIFLIVIVFLFIVLRKRNKLLLFGASCFYLPLIALSSFNYFFAKRGNELLIPEHNLYFSYFGLLILFIALPPVLQAKKAVKLTLLFGALIYAALTIKENYRWQNEIKFYETTLSRSGRSIFRFPVYANLGYAYEKAGKNERAESCFRKAADLSGNDPYFYNILAEFYLRNKKIDAALTVLFYSEELDPDFIDTRLLLGITYFSKGEKAKSLNNFREALLLNPAHKLAQDYIKLIEVKNKK